MPGHFNDEGYGPESSSTGPDAGGGVDTGDHDGDEKYGSDTGGSSSRSKVSPENSPGHPANAPTGSTRSTGPGAGGPSVGGGGGGSSQGNENSPGHPATRPTRLAVAAPAATYRPKTPPATRPTPRLAPPTAARPAPAQPTTATTSAGTAWPNGSPKPSTARG